METSREPGAARCAAALDDNVLLGREGERLLRHIGDKTMVRENGRWTDTSWDREVPPTCVESFSAAHLELLTRHPQLARYFTRGPRVLVVVDGAVFETRPRP